ncbi:MAG: hypothetical protein WAN14_21905 [Candidatus Acidiferrales bacterium]
MGLLVQALQRLRWYPMPYHFDFDPANKILRCRFSGRVTDEELKEYYLAASKLAALTDAAAGLSDFSSVDSVDVSPKTIRELASLPPIMPAPSSLRCIIAPSDKVFGLARMFELQGEDGRGNLHVVRTLKDALAILGVLEPKFEPLNPE